MPAAKKKPVNIRGAGMIVSMAALQADFESRKFLSDITERHFCRAVLLTTPPETGRTRMISEMVLQTRNLSAKMPGRDFWLP